MCSPHGTCIGEFGKPYAHEFNIGFRSWQDGLPKSCIPSMYFTPLQKIASIWCLFPLMITFILFYTHEKYDVDSL